MVVAGVLVIIGASFLIRELSFISNWPDLTFFRKSRNLDCLKRGSLSVSIVLIRESTAVLY